jgi:hypothetical protein
LKNVNGAEWHGLPASENMGGGPCHEFFNGLLALRDSASRPTWKFWAGCRFKVDVVRGVAANTNSTYTRSAERRKAE